MYLRTAEMPQPVGEPAGGDIRDIDVRRAAVASKAGLASRALGGRPRSTGSRPSAAMVLSSLLEEAEMTSRRLAREPSAEHEADAWTSLAHRLVAEKRFFPAIRLYEKCNARFYHNTNRSLRHFIVRVLVSWSKHLLGLNELEMAFEKMRECQRRCEVYATRDPSDRVMWRNLAMAKLANATWVLGQQVAPPEVSVQQAMAELAQAESMFMVLEGAAAADVQAGATSTNMSSWQHNDSVATQETRERQPRCREPVEQDSSNPFLLFYLASAKLAEASCMIRQAEPSDESVRQAMAELVEVDRLFTAVQAAASATEGGLSAADSGAGHGSAAETTCTRHRASVELRGEGQLADAAEDGPVRKKMRTMRDIV